MKNFLVKNIGMILLLIGIVAVMLYPSYSKYTEVPTVVATPLPKLIANDDKAMTQETQRIKERQSCVTTMWSQINSVPVNQRNYFVEQIKLTCGLQNKE